jgi:hypothetical protein
MNVFQHEYYKLFFFFGFILNEKIMRKFEILKYYQFEILKNDEDYKYLFKFEKMKEI